jgi:hypothetical protein
VGHHLDDLITDAVVGLDSTTGEETSRAVVNTLGVDGDGVRSFSTETARSSKNGLLRKEKSKSEGCSELRVGHSMHRCFWGDFQPHPSVRVLKTKHPGDFNWGVEVRLNRALVVGTVLGRDEVLKGGVFVILSEV